MHGELNLYCRSYRIVINLTSNEFAYILKRDQCFKFHEGCVMVIFINVAVIVVGEANLVM